MCGTRVNRVIRELTGFGWHNDQRNSQFGAQSATKATDSDNKKVMDSDSASELVGPGQHSDDAKSMESDSKSEWVGLGQHSGDKNSVESDSAFKSAAQRQYSAAANSIESAQVSGGTDKHSGLETIDESEKESDQLNTHLDKANAAGSGQRNDGQQSLAAMYRFRSTSDLIQSCQKYELQSQIMINFHPQRWTDDFIPLIREWLIQNVKNMIKRGLILVRG